MLLDVRCLHCCWKFCLKLSFLCEANHLLQFQIPLSEDLWWIHLAWIIQPSWTKPEIIHSNFPTTNNHLNFHFFISNCAVFVPAWSHNNVWLHFALNPMHKFELLLNIGLLHAATLWFCTYLRLSSYSLYFIIFIFIHLEMGWCTSEQRDLRICIPPTLHFVATRITKLTACCSEM